MQRLSLSLGAAALVLLVLAGGVVAADPTASPGAQVRARDTIPTVLGLTRTEVMELRHDGLSLAQIAERQKVDPQKLVDALKAQWTERIDARVAIGAITAATADTLKSQVEAQAKDMVYKVTLGGMRGAAVGAGAGQMGAGRMGAGRGMGGWAGGSGVRPCDGTGPAATSTQ